MNTWAVRRMPSTTRSATPKYSSARSRCRRNDMRSGDGPLGGGPPVMDAARRRMSSPRRSATLLRGGDAVEKVGAEALLGLVEHRRQPGAEFILIGRIEVHPLRAQEGFGLLVQIGLARAVRL